MHECSKPCTPCPEQHAELFRWQDVVEFALVSTNPRHALFLKISQEAPWSLRSTLPNFDWKRWAWPKARNSDMSVISWVQPFPAGAGAENKGLGTPSSAGHTTDP